MMTKYCMALIAGLALLMEGAPCYGVELTVSRQALERTLKQQLFSGPDGRYYLKGNPHSACFISTEDPHLSFEQGRIVVRPGADKTDARMGHHALVLSDRAEVDAKPELEIFADDVA